MSWKYTRDEQGNPVPVGDTDADLFAWAKWWENSDNRSVAHDTILTPGGKLMVTVSTIFLGLDHNWRDTGKPVLWETMVFLQRVEPRGPLTGIRDFDDCYQKRYSSERAAVANHKNIVEFLRPSVHSLTKPPTHAEIRRLMESYFISVENILEEEE